MGQSKKLFLTVQLVLLLFLFAPRASLSLSSPSPDAVPSLYREYIGAMFKGVRFSDVPIHPGIDFHFILSFAIDYDSSSSSPSPTNGRFNIFWDTNNLAPAQVASIKSSNSKVKVAVSLGGATVGSSNTVYFSPSNPNSWVSNAVSSLTAIIKQYHLDGIDIDYESFKADPDTFAECIGQLISTLKSRGVISFASIAPFANDAVQKHYLALWSRYGHLIDYVNFQFYAYAAGTTVSQFISYFNEQSQNYRGGKVLVSFISDGSGGLSPANGFFTACGRLKSEGKLHGIFAWCADDSKAEGFKYEKQSQALLAASH